MVLFCISCWWQQENSHSLGKRATERSSWVNLITRQMTPFFSTTIWTLSVGTFHFYILGLSKFSSMTFALCFMFWSVSSSFTCQNWQLQTCYGSTNKKFMLCLADFGHWRYSDGGGESANPLIKGTLMKKSCFR